MTDYVIVSSSKIFIERNKFKKIYLTRKRVNFEKQYLLKVDNYYYYEFLLYLFAVFQNKLVSCKWNTCRNEMNIIQMERYKVINNVVWEGGGGMDQVVFHRFNNIYIYCVRNTISTPLIATLYAAWSLKLALTTGYPWIETLTFIDLCLQKQLLKYINSFRKCPKKKSRKVATIWSLLLSTSYSIHILQIEAFVSRTWLTYSRIFFLFIKSTAYFRLLSLQSQRTTSHVYIPFNLWN